MPRNITYQNVIRQEENTPLVTVLETRVDTKQSTAVDSRRAGYVIDLAKSSFGGIHYPVPGSQWYLKKISGVWTLMARAPKQNPELNPSFTPVAGETYIGGEGNTNVIGNISIVDGRLSWKDGSGVQIGELYVSGGDLVTDKRMSATGGFTSLADVFVFGQLTGNKVNAYNWLEAASRVQMSAHNGVSAEAVLKFSSDGTNYDSTITAGTASRLDFDSLLQVTRGTAGSSAFASWVSGDSSYRYLVTADGKHEWGSGSASRDTNLYRSAASVLQTDDTFKVTPAQGSASKAIEFNHSLAIYVDNIDLASASGARMWIDGPDAADFVIGPRTGANLFGIIRLRGAMEASNIYSNTTSITPVANTPTAKVISGLSLAGTGTVTCFVTAGTTVPGSSVHEVSYASESTTGVTLYIYRVNTSSTSVSYLLYVRP